MHEVQLYLQSHVTWTSVIEILVLTFAIYEMLLWIQGTQAEQVVKGFILLLFLLPISEWLGFTTFSFIIRNMFTWLFVMIIIVFQPELRSALEQIGSSGFIKSMLKREDKIDVTQHAIDEVIFAVERLSATKTGALIVCKAQSGLKNIADTGVPLHSEISWELLLNIFTVNTPLHDGAVIISFETNTIVAAGCLLPLTARRDLTTTFGTRHRAGIGMSEQSDAFIIIVSEETGKISTAENGTFIHDVSAQDLEKALVQRYITPLEQDRHNSWFKTKQEAS